MTGIFFVVASVVRREQDLLQARCPTSGCTEPCFNDCCSMIAVLFSLHPKMIAKKVTMFCSVLFIATHIFRYSLEKQNQKVSQCLALPASAAAVPVPVEHLLIEGVALFE